MNKFVLVAVLLLLLLSVGVVAFSNSDVSVKAFHPDWVEQSGCPNGYRYASSDYCVKVKG